MIEIVDAHGLPAAPDAVDRDRRSGDAVRAAVRAVAHALRGAAETKRSSMVRSAKSATPSSKNCVSFSTKGVCPPNRPANPGISCCAQRLCQPLASA